jgi:hypothetical protein
MKLKILSLIIVLVLILPARLFSQEITDNLSGKSARIGQLVQLSVKKVPEGVVLSKWRVLPETDNFLSINGVAAFSGELPGKYQFLIAFYAPTTKKIDFLVHEVVVEGELKPPTPQDELDRFFQSGFSDSIKILSLPDKLKLSLIFRMSDGASGQELITNTYNTINDEFNGASLDAIADMLAKLEPILSKMGITTKEQLKAIWLRISEEIKKHAA